MKKNIIIETFKVGDKFQANKENLHEIIKVTKEKNDTFYKFKTISKSRYNGFEMNHNSLCNLLKFAWIKVE